MQQIKRERKCNSVDDDDSAKKFKIESNSSSRKSITHFEDLSNETIFEIFELLNFDHLYKAFSDLNTRFQNLLADSHCSITFNLSWMSKLTFQHYYTEIIKPNQHRIKSLSLPNTFMINHILTPFSNASKLLRLETFTVNSIFSKYLDELFQCLSALPLLSKLSIFAIDYVKDKAKLYCQILGLCGLKYCKICLEGCNISKPLSITSNTSSSIEHLVIKDNLHINTLMVLLSYIPHLRHLSVNRLCKPPREKIMKSCSITFNQLTYLDLDVDNIVFDDFALLIKNLSPPLNTLRLTADSDATYLDGRKWQEFILSNMPYLRIFDIHVFYPQRPCVFNSEAIAKWNSLLRTFQSSFYFNRQWFFAYQYGENLQENGIFFYSTDPYRRKKYSLCTKIEKLSPTYQTTRNDSVKSVLAPCKEDILDYSNYFPNATELETSPSDFQYPTWNKLSRILPLQQLTKVVFHTSDRNLKSITGLLNLTPNLYTLIIAPSDILFARENYILPQKDNTFQLVANTNHIETLIICAYLTLEEIKLFMNLCPRVEHLTVWVGQNVLRQVLQFLLSKNDTEIRHLNSLLIERTSANANEIMESLIESDKLQVDYIIGNNTDEQLRSVYLWL